MRLITIVAETQGRGESGIGIGANTVFSAACALLLALTPFAHAQGKTFQQRGKVTAVSDASITLEAVDLPAPQNFVITGETEHGSLRAGELVQVTFVVAGERRLARSVAEIVATPINLPRGQAAGGGASAAGVNVPTGSAADGGGSSVAVNLPRGSAAQHALSSAPISLAADESQMALIKGPVIHESGVHDPIRIAILDFQTESTPELTASVSERLAGLLQNDALLRLLDRTKLHDLKLDGLGDPASIVGLAGKLDAPDAILLGEIKEEVPAEPASDGPRRHRIQAAFPTILLEARLYDARSGQLLGNPKGQGGGSQDRADDRSSPLARAVRDAVESLAAAIDAEYPELLDSRTFVTVASGEPGRLSVTFPAAPTVQLGNRLRVSYPTWFARDLGSGRLKAVSAEPLGILTVTGIERSVVSGTYQGTMPEMGQTVRLSR